MCDGCGVVLLRASHATPPPLVNQKHTTMKAKMVLTETGEVLAEKEVGGDVDDLAALHALTTKLIEALVTDPKFIASLSPAERKSWGNPPV